jgi:hypothetical protein
MNSGTDVFWQFGSGIAAIVLCACVGVVAAEVVDRVTGWWDRREWWRRRR